MMAKDSCVRVRRNAVASLHILEVFKKKMSLFVSRENSLKSKGLIVVRFNFFVEGANSLGLSRMEMYLAIIKVLDTGDSMAQQQIIRKAGINLVPSKEFFNFLVRLGIIREKNLGTKVVYSITDKGLRLCAYFGLDDSSIFSGTGIFRID
jgi:predicted transcriptional regulator